MFNPGAFVDVIQCACADTFKAVFPQCVDCFLRTGQERVIMGEDLPSVVEGIRRICAVASTLVGNVTDSNNAPPPPVAEGTGTRTVQAVSFTSVLLVAGLSVAAMLAGS
ncbi:hypothetical protein CC1G_09409 [Coprinopsis cinerea okayama7|uniref:Uncharacterized protein n=1 Tax=Coprinopsis cinerea (strain Okayama-7 / 130 / ATCC MYA-4618 / FGSC 9003) TaxID=240176 RepID=A8NIH2_COPC7|nr:hypothetical protein CC1G_09409 [Coprinopsis cinerea okayama7\|eukprot:XP_001833995.1 hypothetical protein CC1G_09409 [Coprinopsis cinerea okayama7\